MQNILFILLSLIFLVSCSKSSDGIHQNDNLDGNLLGDEWKLVLHEHVEIFGIYTDNTFSHSYYTGEQITNLVEPLVKTWLFTDSLLIQYNNNGITQSYLWDYHNKTLSLKYLLNTLNTDWFEYGQVDLLTNDSLVISRPLIEDHMIWGEDPIQFTDLHVIDYYIRN